MEPAEEPAPAPADAATYPFWVARLARFLLRVFFGRIDVVGAASVPTGRPLLFVANHNNGLIDPALVLGFVPGRPRFLGKATLWSNPVVRPFLALGRVIPVHRPHESAGGAAEKNEETFRRCREVLAAGGAIAMFPEGKSHSGPGLGELRTGAARILAGLPQAAREGVAVVPVGLLYDAPGRFRSRVLVKVGEPESAADLLGRDAEPDVRGATLRLAVALESVTLSYGSWEEARLVERAADLWLLPDPELPVQPAAADRFAARRRVLERYRELADARPERLAPLERSLAAYDRLLSAFGLRDDQVGAAYPSPSVARFVGETLWLLLVRLPLGAIGTVLNYLPFKLCGRIGARVADHPDMPGSYQLFGGIVLYPLFWAVEATLTGWLWGAPWAALVLLLGPLGGWAAMRFRDRVRLLRTEARAYLMLRGPGRLGGELRRRRDEVREGLLELAAEIGEASGPEPRQDER
jgi:glycerol-3-phosphate O-acyltransferase/dihydroxyacetone phosphate acyltransferase